MEKNPPKNKPNKEDPSKKTKKKNKNEEESFDEELTPDNADGAAEAESNLFAINKKFLMPSTRNNFFKLLV